MTRAARSFVLATAAVAGVLLATGGAGAHDMNATVTVRADAVRVEVFFEEDVPAERAKMSVCDAAGVEVIAGTTDERGVWAFPVPPAGTYRLTATCIGHTATVSFTVAGAPEAEPVSHTGARLNKAVGLGVGAGGLLGASALYWRLRRKAV